MNEDDADDEREFPPAEGIVFRLDRVTDDLETVERLVAAGKIPASDDEHRRMRALLEKFFGI